MLLIAGLGNPGSKYSLNRHNIGFMVLDSLAETYTDGKWRKKFHGQIIECSHEGRKILLLKPQTFMNKSGLSVGEVVKFYKISPLQVMVFHDEIDLAPGKVRVKTGGGHAGHNGLKSIIDHIGPDFVRIRIGVGHPGSKELVHNHVLSNFSKKEQTDFLAHLISGVKEGFPYLIGDNQTEFLNKVNLALPQKTKGENFQKNQKKLSFPKENKETGIFTKLTKFFG